MGEFGGERDGEDEKVGRLWRALGSGGGDGEGEGEGDYKEET